MPRPSDSDLLNRMDTALSSWASATSDHDDAIDLAPEAAAALDMDDDPIRSAARMLGLDPRYADGFASAFDGDALTAPHSLSPEYQTGHADGAACRAELLTATGKEG